MIMLSSYEICGVITLCLLLVAFIYCAYWIGRKQGSESWVDDIVKGYKDTSPYSYKVTASSELSDGDPDVAVSVFPNFTVYRTGAGSNADPFPLTIDRERFLGEEDKKLDRDSQEVFDVNLALAKKQAARDKFLAFAAKAGDPGTSILATAEAPKTTKKPKAKKKVARKPRKAKA